MVIGLGDTGECFVGCADLIEPIIIHLLSLDLCPRSLFPPFLLFPVYRSPVHTFPKYDILPSFVVTSLNFFPPSFRAQTIIF